MKDRFSVGLDTYEKYIMLLLWKELIICIIIHSGMNYFDKEGDYFFKLILIIRN